MGLTWTISIYFVTWWIVLFAILPLGIRNQREAGENHPLGSDPGAPVKPQLLKKFITTSWITAILVGLLWLGFFFDLIRFPAPLPLN
jgi:predicted secreted protein